jgi:serine/threonine protein kinase/tetratricopeptide (TPR) repeat protein
MDGEQGSGPVDGGDAFELEVARRCGEYADLLASGEAVALDEFLKDTPAEVAVVVRRELRTLSSFELGDDGARKLQFTDFKIERLLGEGGMGRVYLATQVSLGRKVALKVLPPGLGADFKHVARFYREGQAQGRLRHPGIVAAYTMGEEGGTPYIAMELAEGRTLSDVLKAVEAEAPGRGRWSDRTPFRSFASLSKLFESLGVKSLWTPREPGAPPLVSPVPGVPADETGRRAAQPPGIRDLSRTYFLWLAEAAAGAADGLDHAHRNGVVHRDLKPSNLILEPGGRLRILDFGLAWVEGQTQLTGNRPVGTLPYMSPEQLRGEQVLGPATDIYSFGAALYEMITSRKVFAVEVFEKLEHEILHVDPVRPRRWSRMIPRDLEAIVLACLRKEPRERYPTAAALAEDLRRFGRGEPVQPPMQPLPLRAARLARRWRRPVLKGATVLAAAAFMAQVFVIGPLERERKRDLAQYDEHVRAASAGLIEHHLGAASMGTGRVGARKVGAAGAGRAGFEGGRSHFMVADSRSDAALEAENYVFEAGPAAIGVERDPVDDALDRLQEAVSLLPGKAIAHVYMARALLIQGRQQEARKHLLRARAIEPLAPQVLGLLASLETGETAAGKRLLEEIHLALDGLSGQRAAGAWLQAQAAFLAGDWESAALAHESLIAQGDGKPEEYPGSRLEVLLHAGIARLNMVDVAGAIEHFARGRELWRGGIELALVLGKLYLLDGKRGKADRLFAQLEEGGNLAGAERRAIAAAYAEAGEFAKALEWAAGLPESAADLRLRADLLRGAGKLDEALAIARRVRDLEPSAAGAIALAEVRRARGELEAACEECRAADRLSARDDVRPLVALALCLEDMDRPADAERALREAIGRAPDRWQPHYNLARLLVRQDRPGEALESLDAARAADPENALVLNNRGCLLDGAGKRAEAIEAYRAATRAAPLFGPARYNLALALHREQRFEEAAREYRKAEACGVPGETGLYRDLASCLANSGAWEEALDLYARAARFEPRRALVFHDTARVRVWRGEFEEARAAYARALRLEPGSALLWEGFGGVLERLGNPSEAIAAYGKALAIDPGRLVAQNGRAKLLLRSEEPPLSWDALAAEIGSLEAAARLEGASRAVPALLEKRRRAFLPDLASPASVDWAIEAPHVLIPEGASWKFRRGESEPSALLEWTEAGFDDDGWETGAEPFGQPGTMHLATLLDDMHGAYSTVYLRRPFEVPDPSRIDGLVLSVRVDDGFVAYVNGKEAARFRGGEAGARLPCTALADEKDGHDWTALDFPIDAGLLQAGANVLALQGLNGEVESDFILSPSLRAKPVLDAARLEEVRPALAAFEEAARGADAPARLAYLQGRARDIAGDAAGARASYLEALRLDPAAVEPRLRLGASLRAAGEAPAAAEVCREAIASGLAGDRRLWDAWLEVHFVDLGSPPGDLLAAFPAPPATAPGGPAADIRWLLEALDRGSAIRLAAGGREHAAPDGTAWSGDRFFRGGEPLYLSWLDEQAVPGPLHRTERFFPEGGVEIPGYRIPLPSGRYRIRLHFIEGYHRDDGRRREFDILLEGHTAFPGFDPAEAGFGVPRMKEVRMDVADGALDVGFRRRIDLPNIAGLEIERLPPAAELQPAVDGGGGGRTRTSGGGLQPDQSVRSR